MSSKLRWLTAALEDLEQIRAYYNELEPDLGTQFIRQIFQQVENLLEEFPAAGRPFGGGRQGARQFVFDTYRVIYQVTSESVRVLAVLDSRRDFQQAKSARKRFL